ncbi:MAG TPA: hypothetical protein VN520_02050 [Streptomyces sp.]|uniref:hypothetical protein n=1 Tax=Streptomyces sp. TaxID=1931 RepID=UPI002C901399|nr:hypothetical protein [Streptomyces sp.]HWU05187.1 hypothetical protein [Streptomyces sp.]
MLFGSSVEALPARDKDSEPGLGLEAGFAPDRHLGRPLVDSEDVSAHWHASWQNRCRPAAGFAGVPMAWASRTH